MSNELNTQPERDDEDFQLDENKLGIAGRITRQFINSPVTPLLTSVVLAWLEVCAGVDISNSGFSTPVAFEILLLHLISIR